MHSCDAYQEYASTSFHRGPLSICLRQWTKQGESTWNTAHTPSPSVWVWEACMSVTHASLLHHYALCCRCCYIDRTYITYPSFLFSFTPTRPATPRDFAYSYQSSHGHASLPPIPCSSSSAALARPFPSFVVVAEQ